MSGSASLGSWLWYSAGLSLAVLALGSGGVLLCRQPARRLRIIELTLAACLVAPGLAIVPGYPQWPTRWWPISPPERQEIAAAPLVGPGASFRPGLAAGETNGPHDVDRNWGFAVVAIYLLGIGLCGAWWLTGVAGLARLLAGARAAPPRCRRLLDEIAGPRGERVRLLTSRRLRQPLASVGILFPRRHGRAAWLRPVIILPEDLCDDEQAVRWALAHEWTHLARNDFRAWLVAGLARIVFYYQPLVWWLRRQLRLCQDLLADARASREAPEPEDYAEFLARRAASGVRLRAMAGLGMAFCESELSRRVRMLVQDRPLEERAPRWWNGLVGLAALLLIGILPALSPSAKAAAHGDQAWRPGRSAGAEVRFAIGPQAFARGDRIVIHEVRSKLGSLARGDTVTVRGSYTLASHRSAALLFSVTSTARHQPGCTLRRPIGAGAAPFELELAIAADGYLHLGFYDPHNPFGNVYFGTAEQMRKIAHWDLEEWIKRKH